MDNVHNGLRYLLDLQVDRNATRPGKFVDLNAYCSCQRLKSYFASQFVYKNVALAIK